MVRVHRHARRAVIDEGVDHPRRREDLIAHEAGERLAGDALDHHGHEQEIGIIVLVFPPGRETLGKLPRLARELGGIVVADPKGLVGHRHVLQIEVARQAGDVVQHVGDPDRRARILRQLRDEPADVVIDRDQAALLQHQQSGRREGLGDRGDFKPGPGRDGGRAAQVGEPVALHEEHPAGLDQKHGEAGIERLGADPVDEPIHRILEPLWPLRPFQSPCPGRDERHRAEPRPDPEHLAAAERHRAGSMPPPSVRTIRAGHLSLPAAAPAPQRPHFRA